MCERSFSLFPQKTVFWVLDENQTRNFRMTDETLWA